ncbi:hypothetical protein V1525DRAFT_253602 [Lipomyces kononenkoae]|uniref:Uncharacterized protein n=1 Tax=Lipomyces kononenkoae TaxID=34357 RepID=A0ACC3SVN4_LIPKO
MYKCFKGTGSGMLAVIAMLIMALLRPVEAQLTEVLPFACETTDGSPLQADCVQIVRDYICVESGCLSPPTFNGNPSGSDCTTLAWTRGTCAIAVCGAVGGLDPGSLGAVLAGILSSCTDGTRVGGKTDILGFFDQTQTIEWIHSGTPGKRSVQERLRQRDNVNARDIVNGAQQWPVPNTGYTLELIGSRNPSEPLSTNEANSLTGNWLAALGQQPWNARTVHGSTQSGWEGFADLTYYVNPTDNYLGDFAPDEPAIIAQAVQDFWNYLR